MTTKHLSCTAIIQGGARRPVLAIGRLGKKRILVRYTIKSGAKRERWLPLSRVFDLVTVEVLPPYVRSTCPGGLVAGAPDVTSADWNRFDALRLAGSTCGMTDEEALELWEIKTRIEHLRALRWLAQTGCPCKHSHSVDTVDHSGQCWVSRRPRGIIVRKEVRS